MFPLTIVKIGGNVLDDDTALISFLRDFHHLEGCKILVHGGGKIATGIGRRLGLEAHYVAGRRVTDAATLELVTMVYGGLVNKKVVALLQQAGCNALGLTGADGNIMKAGKRPVRETDYGFVGDVKQDGVQVSPLKSLLEAGFAPVIAPLTHDGNGSLLNTNADTIAQELAKAMSAAYTVRLVYCFEKKGVLADVQDERSLIRSIRRQDLQQLKDEGIVADGMIPKLENALAAVAQGVSKVIIGHAAELPQLLAGTSGTHLS